MNVYVWEDLRVGLTHEFDAVVTDEMMRRFLDATGDVNPLHVDPEYARERGFQDRVVYGLLTAAFYSTLVGVHLPGRNALLQGLNITFQNPVYVGMALRVSGEITFLSDAYRRMDIAGRITSDGSILSKAKIIAGVL